MITYLRLINALVSVFVPEDGYFKDYFDRLNVYT